MTTEQWLLEAVGYYRQLGFFQGYTQSDEELAELEGKKLIEEWGEDPNSFSDHPDLFLLANDPQRVWWMDMEADVFPGNNVYVETLREWGGISRGSFNPREITEEWKSEQGPIFVTFHHNGKRYSLSPKYWGDFIDIAIIPELNRLIQDTGIQFEPYETFDQTCFLVALTADEKRRLRFERGWKFLF